MKTAGSEQYRILCKKIIGSIPSDESGLEQLRHLYHRVFDSCQNRSSPFLLISELELFAYENRVSAENLRLYLETIQSNRIYLKQILSKGISDGSIRKDIDPEAYTTLLTNTYIGLIQRMEAVRYTKTDYNLASFEEQVELYINTIITYLRN